MNTGNSLYVANIEDWVKHYGLSDKKFDAVGGNNQCIDDALDDVCVEKKTYEQNEKNNTPTFTCDTTVNTFTDDNERDAINNMSTDIQVVSPVQTAVNRAMAIKRKRTTTKKKKRTPATKRKKKTQGKKRAKTTKKKRKSKKKKQRDIFNF